MGSFGLILTACAIRYALFFPAILVFFAVHLLSAACGLESTPWSILSAGILFTPIAVAGVLAGQGADSILGIGKGKLFAPTAAVAALYLVLITDIPIQIVEILASAETMAASQLLALSLAVMGKLLFVVTAVLLSLGGLVASFEFLLSWAVGAGQVTIPVGFVRPLLIGFIFALSLQLISSLLLSELSPLAILKDTSLTQ